MPDHEGHLTHHCFDAPVQGRDHTHCATGITRAPDPDAILVDLAQGLGVGDRGAIVAALPGRINFAARPAIARTETAIVIDQYGHAGLREHLGELVQGHFLHPGEAVCHDNGRVWPLTLVGLVEPAA